MAVIHMLLGALCTFFVIPSHPVHGRSVQNQKGLLKYLTKPHHPVPTYFRRLNKDGDFIDRSSRSYGSEIPGKIDVSIRQSDAASAVLTLKPNPVKNGGKVTVIWSGVSNSTSNDWIGYYCPKDDKAGHHLDYLKVDASSTWAKGYGSHDVILYNMRTECEFRYYRSTESSSQLVVRSNAVQFVNGPKDPLQGRLALTGDPSEMRVMWTSAVVDKPTVMFGLTEEKLDQIAYGTSTTYKASDMCGAPANAEGFWDPGYMHDVLLKSLKPNTKYFYSFGSKEVMSPTYNFTTALPAGDTSSFKFIVYGDQGLSPYPRAKGTEVRVLEEYHENDIRFIFHNGDISYAEGQAYIWEQWHALIQPYSTLVPYMVGIGNHEQDHTTGGSKDPSGAPGEGFHPLWGMMTDDSQGECGVPMYRRFHMPDNGNKLWWYSFDYGSVHVIMMSTEHNFQPGSRQYKWLENDLKNVDRKKTPWVIFGGHRPMYTSSMVLADFICSKNMQRVFEDLLYKYKVDLVFWAHMHSYERTCRVYKGVCRDDGLIHIIVGSAGKGHDSDNWFKESFSAYHEIGYGYGKVTVANSTSLLYEWVRNKDKIVRDHIWIHK